MSKKSQFHFQVEWAKERLDEMDAALASLERRASETQATSGAKAEQLIASLRKNRDEFQQAMTRSLEAGTAAWAHEKSVLESRWDGFAAELDKDMESFGKGVATQQAIFLDLAAAQTKAWHDAGAKLQGAATEFLGERRTEIEKAVQQMKAEATKAETRLQKMSGAGYESWKALSGALAESRAAFDHAVHAARDVFSASGAQTHRPDERPRH